MKSHQLLTPILVIVIALAAIGFQLQGGRWAFATTDPDFRPFQKTDGIGFELDAYVSGLRERKQSKWLVVVASGCRACSTDEDPLDRILRHSRPTLVILPQGIALPTHSLPNHLWVNDIDGQVAAGLQVRAMPRYSWSDGQGRVVESVTEDALLAEVTR